MSEVHTNIEGEHRVVGRVEIIVRDVRQSVRVADISIEDIVADATSELQSAVESLETWQSLHVIAERVVSRAVMEILYLAAHTACEIT